MWVGQAAAQWVAKDAIPTVFSAKQQKAGYVITNKGDKGEKQRTLWYKYCAFEHLSWAGLGLCGIIVSEVTNTLITNEESSQRNID